MALKLKDPLGGLAERYVHAAAAEVVRAIAEAFETDDHRNAVYTGEEVGKVLRNMQRDILERGRDAERT